MEGGTEMYRIFTRIKISLSTLVAIPCPPDPLSAMSPAELADLPVTHPDPEPSGC
jgi:hypothetical protein